MKKLVVYFTVSRMGESVAKRGMFGPPKEYKTTPMRMDFDPYTIPDLAIAEIKQKYGEKPEQRTPMSMSTQLGHQFAEIRYWRFQDVFEREPEAIDELYQPELFPEFEQK